MDDFGVAGEAEQVCSCLKFFADFIYSVCRNIFADHFSGEIGDGKDICFCAVFDAEGCGERIRVDRDIILG